MLFSMIVFTYARGKIPPFTQYHGDIINDVNASINTRVAFGKLILGWLHGSCIFIVVTTRQTPGLASFEVRVGGQGAGDIKNNFLKVVLLMVTYQKKNTPIMNSYFSLG